MNITTKFAPGDKVWVMKDNKPHEFTVESVKAVAFNGKNGKAKVSVTVNEQGKPVPNKDLKGVMYLSEPTPHAETECFPTKDKLLDSLR